jgi:hypothetical protein
LDPPTKQFFLFLFFHLIGAKIVAKNCARVAMKLWRIEFTLTSLKKTRRAAVFGGTTMSIQKKIPGEKGRKHRPVNVTKKGKKGKNRFNKRQLLPLLRGRRRLFLTSSFMNLYTPSECVHV